MQYFLFQGNLGVLNFSYNGRSGDSATCVLTGQAEQEVTSVMVMGVFTVTHRELMWKQVNGRDGNA